MNETVTLTVTPLLLPLMENAVYCCHNLEGRSAIAEFRTVVYRLRGATN